MIPLNTRTGALLALLTLGVSAAAADGPALYREHCAKCHGDTGQADNWRGYLDNHGVGASAPGAVRHCHGYGCRLISTAKLGKKDWAQIAALFRHLREHVPDAWRDAEEALRAYVMSINL